MGQSKSLKKYFTGLKANMKVKVKVFEIIKDL